MGSLFIFFFSSMAEFLRRAPANVLTLMVDGTFASKSVTACNSSAHGSVQSLSLPHYTATNSGMLCTAEHANIPSRNYWPLCMVTKKYSRHEEGSGTKRPGKKT